MRALLLAVAMVAAVSAQDPQQEPPARFRSSIDLVPVDVSVVDRDGRPVDDLKPGDFTLTVDGKPRRIASAELIRARNVDAPARVPYYSSNVGAVGGRLIMIVIDQANIGAGRARRATEAAARFVQGLSPADRVGLFAIPGAGPQIGFTSNHAAVLSELKNIVGQAQTIRGPRQVGLSEAARIDRGDQRAMSEIIDRVCAGAMDAGERTNCISEIEQEARTLVADARQRTADSLTSLRHVMERLAVGRGAKTIVFISEGLLLDRDVSSLGWVPAVAARGQVSMYVMMLDAGQMDVTSVRPSPTNAEDVYLAEEGLEMLAGMARGTVFRVTSSPDIAFGRLTRELSAYYLLGFEPEPGDRDGKPHKIKVEVRGRKGLFVRSRAEFNVPPPRTRPTEEVVAETLNDVLMATDIGLKVATYVMREPDSQKLRVIFALDIDRSTNPAGRAAVGYTVTDSRGRVIASRYEPDIASPVRPGLVSQQFVGAATMDSQGTYLLKAAVVDDRGLRGSVEHAFRAQLTSTGQIRATDLMIAENSGPSAGGVTPAVTAEFTTDMLHGYLELYSSAREPLQNTSVTIEVADSENGRTLDSTPASIKDADESRRIAEAAVPIALLPPGEYVARAVINIGGRKAGQVTRPFRIARSAATTAGSSAAVRGSRPPIPFTSRIDTFDRKAVLSPQVVGFFVERMNVGNRSSVAPAVAEHAREGRFDEAVEAVRKAGNDQLAVTFFTALALYQKGDFEAAAVKFRETLKIDSEFFPAAFYLGSCYAAGGRDREAAAAWQTSLVTESDAPFIYTLLGDALLRSRNVDQAIDILKEANSLWPNNSEVQFRYATALAMGEQTAEALAILDPYLEKHPQDHERHFLALRAIYEAHAAGRTVKTVDDDRARFDRYAAAYAAAGGPQQALVEQWKKFMQKRQF